MSATSVIWVTGGTDWSDEVSIKTALRRYRPGSVLLHGAATGADQIAGIYGKELGFLVVEIPYVGALGRAGGPVRNQLLGRIGQLLADSKNVIPVCLAFGGGSGTAGSVEIARELGYLVERW